MRGGIKDALPPSTERVHTSHDMRLPFALLFALAFAGDLGAQSRLRVAAAGGRLRVAPHADSAVQAQLPPRAWVEPDTNGVLTGQFILVRAGGRRGWLDFAELSPPETRVNRLDERFSYQEVQKRGDDPDESARDAALHPGVPWTCRIFRRRCPKWDWQPGRPVFHLLRDQSAVIGEDLVYRVGSTSHSIRVSKGFITDFASIPRAMWPILPPWGIYKFAAVVHDYLYWTQSCSRDQADRHFFIAMVEDSVPAWQRNAVYAGVRVGGEAAWKSNTERRTRGASRWWPDLPAGSYVKGEELMATLEARKAKDPTQLPTPQEACVLGNSLRVP